MNIFHGSIVTCDKNNNQFKYLVEDRGKIVFVGDELPEQFARHQSVIELGSRALIPAFGDGHLHFSNWALIAGEYFDVRTSKNFKEMGDIITRFTSQDKKSKIIVGFGISSHSVEEQRLITRKELDVIHSKRPLLIVCYDGHSLVANSALIELYPEKIRNLRGFNSDSGQLFNEAYYEGLDYVTSKISLPKLIKSVIGGYDLLAEKGIGLIHTVEGIGFPGDMDVTLVNMIAKARAKKNRFQTRVFFQTLDVKKVIKRKLPRIGGCFAAALDGCFGACDAALVEPYSHEPDNKGILFYRDEEVASFAKEANRAGLQIELHAIGDAAINQAISAIEKALTDTPREDHRHTIIHACLLSTENIERCAKLGIGITLQPGFLGTDLEPVEYLQKILGDRVLTSSALRTMVDSGIHVSGGSDAPVTHPDPIEGMYFCCNHPYDDSQSLSIQEALKLYTYEVAWTSFDEKDRGSLETGKIADMTLLNKNPLELDKTDLKSLKAEQLYLNGEPYKPGMGVSSMLLNSLTSGRVIT
ncbi:amidohydrolase [bacterium]|nr:amidohydrolase [bacterium]